jgi:inorganic phosphate transporter, PiT family
MLPLLGGIFLGWSLGANDASNVFGPAVSSRMIKFWTAAVLASVFVMFGALIQGQEGIKTLQGLTRLTLGFAVVCSVSAALTVSIMTFLGQPVSTSQAVIGAIIGIGLMNRQLNLDGLGKVVVCWIGTPIGAAVIAAMLYKALAALYNRLELNLFQSDALFRILLICAGLYGAYALGANNVANVTAVFVGAGHLSIFSAALIGGLSIDLGILTFSRRVMDTLGRRLVPLDAFSALVVVFAEAITVHIYSFIGVPVSTSQAVVGAVLGVGIVKGIRTVSKRVLGNILFAWFCTPAVSGLIAVVMAFIAFSRYMPPLP